MDTDLGNCLGLIEPGGDSLVRRKQAKRESFCGATNKYWLNRAKRGKRTQTNNTGSTSSEVLNLFDRHPED